MAVLRQRVSPDPATLPNVTVLMTPLSDYNASWLPCRREKPHDLLWRFHGMRSSLHLLSAADQRAGGLVVFGDAVSVLIILNALIKKGA